MNFELTPYIMLDGKAKDAIEFYKLALGAEVVFMQTFGDAPSGPEAALPAEDKGRVAHSVLKVGDGKLFVADVLPGQPNRGGNRVSLCLTANDAEEAQALFDALRQDGQVDFPLQEVYFSPAYGQVTDRFGVVFQIFTKR